LVCIGIGGGFEEEEEEVKNRFFNMATIEIPVRGSENLVVGVPTNDLPDDADDILDILKGELAPLQLWLKFAVIYLHPLALLREVSMG